VCAPGEFNPNFVGRAERELNVRLYLSIRKSQRPSFGGVGRYPHCDTSYAIAGIEFASRCISSLHFKRHLSYGRIFRRGTNVSVFIDLCLSRSLLHRRILGTGTGAQPLARQE
jgi:hypothetical protein